MAHCHKRAEKKEKKEMKQSFSVEMEKGEKWWGGAVMHGVDMPLGEESLYQLDNRVNKTYNQTNGLFTSTHGRYIYIEGEYILKAENGVLSFTDVTGVTEIAEGFSTLRGAFLAACKKYAKRSRKMKKSLLLRPQYCTWMFCGQNQTQEGILQYARGIVESGMPAGLMMIDDGWSYDYGDWRFVAEKFPNPKKLMAELHALGFEIMIWLVPFINQTAPEYQRLSEEKAFVREKDGSVAMREWWSGKSAVFDLTSPAARKYIKSVMDGLREIGVDGFKFDAGDAEYYTHDDVTCAPTTPNGQSLLWAQLAAEYEISELRACCGMMGEAVVQRLCDKRSNWDDREGLGALVPGMLQASMSGYAYCCGDMIGGGQINPAFRIHSYEEQEELLLRACQTAALMPCMQFSYELWRGNATETTRQAAKKAAHMRIQLADYFRETIDRCEENFEPIMRPLEYDFPCQSYESIIDCFMLGEKYLVAPISTRHTTKRTLRLPAGAQWRYVPDGNIYEGGVQVEIDAPYDVLPWFERL